VIWASSSPAYPDANGTRLSAVVLGRAWASALVSPYDGWNIAGDRTYAPPEFLYRDVPSDFKRRRYGCDMYQLGSLAVFFFARTHINALINKYLALEHRHVVWGGTYEEALPYILQAFARAIEEFAVHVPQLVRGQIVDMIKQLCDPDPIKRGHPLNRLNGGRQHSLERYISLLDFLAFKAAIAVTYR
jgi:hypothetical protein